KHESLCDLAARGRCARHEIRLCVEDSQEAVQERVPARMVTNRNERAMQRDVDRRARMPTKTVGSHDVLLEGKGKAHAAHGSARRTQDFRSLYEAHEHGELRMGDRALRVNCEDWRSRAEAPRRHTRSRVTLLVSRAITAASVVRRFSRAEHGS